MGQLLRVELRRKLLAWWNVEDVSEWANVALSEEMARELAECEINGSELMDLLILGGGIILKNKRPRRFDVIAVRKEQSEIIMMKIHYLVTKRVLDDEWIKVKDSRIHQVEIKKNLMFGPADRTKLREAILNLQTIIQEARHGGKS